MKHLKRLFSTDPWVLSTNELHLDDIRLQESLTSIGNGYMGAMIFGDVYVDVIQTNEHTLWSGGPGEDPSYNGGHLRTPEVNKDYLHKARVMLQQKMNDFMNTQELMHVRLSAHW